MSVTLYHKLVEVCQKGGCPLCHLEQEAVRRYLDSLFYESVNDAGVRARLRQSRGFCREHAWLVVNERLSDALGIAVVYRDILNALWKDLDDWQKRLPREEESWPAESCPACQHRDETTDTMLAILFKYLEREDLEAALRRSGGLCLRHLFLALKEARQETARTRLLDIQRERIAALQAELDEFIRKNDYRFAGEGFGAEGDSWKRALGLVAGNNPWKEVP